MSGLSVRLLSRKSADYSHSYLGIYAAFGLGASAVFLANGILLYSLCVIRSAKSELCADCTDLLSMLTSFSSQSCTTACSTPSFAPRCSSSVSASLTSVGDSR